MGEELKRKRSQGCPPSLGQSLAYYQQIPHQTTQSITPARSSSFFVPCAGDCGALIDGAQAKKLLFTLIFIAFTRLRAFSLSFLEIL